MKQRYCLKKDDDSHWYMVPVEQAEAFSEAEEKAYDEDDFDDFEKRFGKYRIDGYHILTFTDPQHVDGDPLV